MNTRLNPDSEENQQMTSDNERVVFAAKMMEKGPACETCVHGYDDGILKGARVYCVPQKQFHAHNYLCTGFREITPKELDERTEGRFETTVARVKVGAGRK